jgi:hypothetical protein
LNKAALGSARIAELARLVTDRVRSPNIHRTKICLFLGAGADISSGGLTFADVKRDTVGVYLDRPLFGVTSPEDIEKQFELAVEGMPPDDRALMVDWMFHRMRPAIPSDAYKLLVLLAEAGGVDAVITTNFDVMLEKAQELLGRDLFQVFAPGVARPFNLTNGRFELVKKPYLKLHGDIAARTVTLLTVEELARPAYDDATLDLLVSILKTHDLIIAGYGGYDTVLAEVIEQALHSTATRVFWCNPSPPRDDSPLLARIAPRVRFVPTKFDDLISEISRPTLQRPSLLSTEPNYVRCLFDWRIEYCNEEFIHAHADRNGRRLVNSFARRAALEDRLNAFLRPNHPLAIVTGPSGYGKTTLGVRLAKVWASSGSTKVMLLRAKTLNDDGDIERHICDQLGGLGSKSEFSLFRLEKWLKDINIRLIIYIDGVNEFSPDLTRCVHFFRSILRFCHFLPETDSSLRIVATVRQETWNAMLPHLDPAQLQSTVWSDGGAAHSFTTVACGPLTDPEVQDALDRLRDQVWRRLTRSASLLDKLNNSGTHFCLIC